MALPVSPVSPPQYLDCGSEMSDCSSMEEGREGRESGRRRNILAMRQDRKARRVESNNRERRRMHELNHAFQVTGSCLPSKFDELLVCALSHFQPELKVLCNHTKTPKAQIQFLKIFLFFPLMRPSLYCLIHFYKRM